jgi:hypothetical protein
MQGVGRDAYVRLSSRKKMASQQTAPIGSSNFDDDPINPVGWLDALKHAKVGGSTWLQQCPSGTCFGHQSRTATHRRRLYMAGDDPDFEIQGR